MFKFLKSLFKEKEVEAETINLNELEKWFNAKTTRMTEELNSEINSIIIRLDGKIKKTKDDIYLLKNAKLKNPKIPPRAIHMMEGNRGAYIRKVGLFLERVNVKDKKIDELLQFCSFFHNALNDFGKSTYRSYQVLQEFFANESEKIAKNIKNIDLIIKELEKTIKDSGIERFDEIKKEINSVKNKIVQKERFIKDLEKLKKEKEDFSENKKNLEGKIDELKKSKEFAEFNELENKFNSILIDIKEHKYNLTHSFSIIEKALKKFSRIAFENEKLMQNYIEAPVTSLLNDRELKITDILKKLEKSINENKIEIDDKKRAKTLKEVEKLNKGFFTNFLNKYNELNKKLDDVEKKTNETAVKSNEEALNKQLVNIKASIENLTNKIETTKKGIEKIDISKIKSDLQEKMNNILKEKIIIS